MGQLGEFLLEYIQRRRTLCFIAILGVTVRSFRSMVTMKRPRWTVSENIVAVGSRMKRLDAIPRDAL